MQQFNKQYVGLVKPLTQDMVPEQIFVPAPLLTAAGDAAVHITLCLQSHATNKFIQTILIQTKK